jgi:hypothetical protein
MCTPKSTLTLFHARPNCCQVIRKWCKQAICKDKETAVGWSPSSLEDRGCWLMCKRPGILSLHSQAPVLVTWSYPTQEKYWEKAQVTSTLHHLEHFKYIPYVTAWMPFPDSIVATGKWQRPPVHFLCLPRKNPGTIPGSNQSPLPWFSVRHWGKASMQPSMFCRRWEREASLVRPP